MKLNKLILIVIIIIGLIAVSQVSASDADINETVNLSSSNDDTILGDVGNTIYVDALKGSNSNSGDSYDSSLKTIDSALTLATDNSTINLANGTYAGDGNTKLKISKSVSIVGSGNTVIDGQNKNYLFIIEDGASVTFKNIKFVNAYKSPMSYSVSFNEKLYGSALDIKNADVIIDNCSFSNNILSFGSNDKYVYGGAVSNLGDLKILNSYFESNEALSDSGLFSYGGAVYNGGKSYINNTYFKNAIATDFGYGGAIANSGEMKIENTVITGSRSTHETKGSAIYNDGDLNLVKSVIENNYIERGNFNCIYGAIYNSGTLTAVGNIFTNNTAYYESPMPAYKGSPNIYNSGILNLTYNAFINNSYYDGISSDIYFNGGEIINLDNNWWSVNTNPYNEGTKINVDEINSWFVFNLIPEYTMLDLEETVEISTFWSLSNGQTPQINLFPLFNVTFKTSYGDEFSKDLKSNNASFIFNHSQNKGSYTVTADVCGFNQSITVDVGKFLTFITVDYNDNITYYDSLKFNIAVMGEDNLPPKGTVSLTIGNNRYQSNLTNGRCTFEVSDMLPGTHEFKVTYEGNDDYFKSFYTSNATIKKQVIDLSVNIPEIKIDQKGYLIATLLPKGVQGQAILYIDGVRKKIVYLYNGDTTISLNNFAEGQYNITLEFVETQYYESATASGILNVTKYTSDFNVTAKDIKVGENATVTISINPEILRGEATLIINGVNNTIFLENATTNIVISNLNAGTYNVTVVYTGDSKYYGYATVTSFKVTKSQTVLNVNIDEDEKNRNGTVTVKISPENCTGQIGLYINYKLYTLNITDGEVTFNVEFDKGTNYIYVFYDGDRYHDGAEWNTTLGIDDEFVLFGENSTGWQYNNITYSFRLLEINGVPMPNRQVTVNFNDKTYTVNTNENGYGYLTLNLNTGKYEISSSYKNTTIHNTITVKEIIFNLTSVNITYGENETAEALFDKKISGKVRFYIDNIIDETVSIINGKASYNISNLNAGNYTLHAIYFKDNFTSEELISLFKVSKADLNMVLDVKDVTPNVDQIIKVQNLKNAGGKIIIRVNGTAYPKEIENSQAVLNLSKLSEGTYSLTVSYDGDLNYNPSEITSVFHIKNSISKIIIEVNDSAYAEEITAIAYLNDNATGFVEFEILNITESVEINGGIAKWNFKGLDVDKYEISATYLGDNYYISSSNSTSFNVVKAKSNIVLYAPGAVLNENIRIYANVSENATGSVSFSMVGYYSPRNKQIVDSTSNWYISPLKTGSYTIKASYSGDKNYYSSDATYILNITQKRSVLTVNIDDVTVNDRVIAKITLTSADGEKINGTITLKIGSKSYSINVNNGASNFIIGKIGADNYTYSASFAGNDKYYKSSQNGEFEVTDNLLDVKLTGLDVVKYYKGSEKLTVSLMSSSNKPISGETVFVKINGKTYELTTDKNGNAYLDLNLKSGKYSAEVTFKGTSLYKNSSINITVEIYPTVEGIDVAKIYGSGTQYFAMFTDSNGKALGNTKVTFKIGSKTLTTTTLPNGISRLNINLSPGSYTISVTNPVTGEKTSNTIKIFLRLMENRDVKKYYLGSQSFKVRAYADNGKPVGAGQTVKIKVNGVTYNVKTDKKGYAALPINLNPGKYTITASYKGFTTKNKVTVKSTVVTKNISKKKSKTVKFTAKLLDNKGKILKGKKITFKFKGKTVKVKTNSKGIATLTIKNNLKVGKYKIKTIYGKLIRTNTVTVKK